MTRPTTLASVVKSSVLKMLDPAIKGLVLSDQTSQSLQLEPCMTGEPTPKTSTIPSIPWLEANSQSGMCMSGKTTWLSKLILDAANHFWDDTGNSALFRQALYCYGSSCQPMFTRMQQDMDVTFHPGMPTIPWEEVFPPEQHPSLLVLNDLMRETVDSDQSDGFTQ